MSRAPSGANILTKGGTLLQDKREVRAHPGLPAEGPADGIHLLFFLLPAAVVVRGSRLSKVSRSRGVFPPAPPQQSGTRMPPCLPSACPNVTGPKGFPRDRRAPNPFTLDYKPAGCLRRNRKRSWDPSASEVGRTSSHCMRGLLEAEERPGGNPLEQRFRSQREKVSAVQD